MISSNEALQTFSRRLGKRENIRFARLNRNIFRLWCFTSNGSEFISSVIHRGSVRIAIRGVDVNQHPYQRQCINRPVAGVLNFHLEISGPMLVIEILETFLLVLLYLYLDRKMSRHTIVELALGL
jgi:hypothetical protein